MVAFAVTNVDYIIVLSVLFARRDLRFHSLSHRGRCDSGAPCVLATASRKAQVRDQVAGLLLAGEGSSAGQTRLLLGTSKPGIGARVAGEAGAGQVVVSGTVRDLVAGSGIEFDDLGASTLKGVPGEWRLFAVRDEIGASHGSY